MLMYVIILILCIGCKATMGSSLPNFEDDDISSLIMETAKFLQFSAHSILPKVIFERYLVKGKLVFAVLLTGHNLIVSSTLMRETKTCSQKPNGKYCVYCWKF